MYFTNDLSMIDHDAKDPNTLRFKKMKTSIVQRKRTIKYWFRVCGRWFAARAAQFSMVLCHETRNMESDNTAMIYFIKFFIYNKPFSCLREKTNRRRSWPAWIARAPTSTPPPVDIFLTRGGHDSPPHNSKNMIFSVTKIRRQFLFLPVLFVHSIKMVLSTKKKEIFHW